MKLIPARDTGFTLVELLVTVIVIAVLAAIAIPLYTSQRYKAMDAATQSDARAVVMKMEWLAPTTGVRWKVAGVSGTNIPTGLTGSGKIKSSDTELIYLALDCSYSGSAITDSPSNYVLWAESINNITPEIMYDSLSGKWYIGGSRYGPFATCPNGQTQLPSS
jgi:prepilin-type N-terminal cleavage/methylation domain-containing protein